MKAYIKKIAYYLPEKIEENPRNRLTKKTGILRRHICSETEIASDLAIKAAQKLFNQGVDRDRVEYIILCTQSPDYYLPTTACLLQEKLGLPENCGAFDYNLGCSGFIYGLSLAKGLIESGQVNNVLLITSETYSKYINPNDGAVLPLFGDAATATFIEAVDTEQDGLSGFVFGTRGSGYDNLIVPVGGMRNRYSATEEVTDVDEFGNTRSNRNIYMNGAAISDFALEVVPDTLEKILAKTGNTRNDIDYFVFHQANKFMLDFLQIKCDLIGYPYWNDVAEYGNTVSSSIPIALVDMMKTNNDVARNKIMTIGFGVGLSWGGCLIDMRCTHACR